MANLEQMLKTNARGCDMSAFQGEPNFENLGKVTNFVIFRGSIGVNRDSKIERNMRLTKGKLPRGMYHVLYPSETASVTAQKTRISELVDRYYPCELPLSLDIEVKGSGIDMMLQLGGRILAETGEYPMIYTGTSFFNGIMGNATQAQLDAAIPFLKQCPLWVAHYKEKEDPDNIAPWGDHWDIWQYGLSGPEVAAEHGIRPWEGRSVDLNIYNGTLQEFNKKFGLDNHPLPPATGEEVAVEVLAEYLWFRKEPAYNNMTKELVLPHGYIAEMAGEDYFEEASGILWTKVLIPEKIGWVSKGSTFVRVIKE